MISRCIQFSAYNVNKYQIPDFMIQLFSHSQNGLFNIVDQTTRKLHFAFLHLIILAHHLVHIPESFRLSISRFGK